MPLRVDDQNMDVGISISLARLMRLGKPFVVKHLGDKTRTTTAGHLIASSPSACL